ncbi:hypothetical protein HY468_01305, partial [Candidatus Roizmanbacteria bacterium]|nr:hypothetical protein [Candidatus Roizmanbacteria bacterium]
GMPVQTVATERIPHDATGYHVDVFTYMPDQLGIPEGLSTIGSYAVIAAHPTNPLEIIDITHLTHVSHSENEYVPTLNLPKRMSFSDGREYDLSTIPLTFSSTIQKPDGGERTFHHQLLLTD